MEIRKIIVAVCLVLASATPHIACAQQRPNMEQLVKMQAQRIACELGLEGRVSQQFVETFCACSREMGATRRMYHRPNKANLTDGEVEKNIKADFEQSRKIVYIREKYYKAYRKFLSPRQVQRVYDLERQDMERFMQRGPRGGGKPKAPLCED
jgi:Spy/CpxP family protein refolding chaperone